MKLAGLTFLLLKRYSIPFILKKNTLLYDYLGFKHNLTNVQKQKLKTGLLSK